MPVARVGEARRRKDPVEPSAATDASTSDEWRIWIPATAVTDMNETSLHVLLWQVFGSAEVTVKDVSHVLHAGNALWIPVGHPHEFRVRENSVTVPLFFDAADTATTLRQPAEVGVDRDLHALMLAYNVSWHTMVQSPVSLARQLLALIEGGTVRTPGLPIPSSAGARQIAAALSFNPGDTRTLDELARSAHISARSMERTFRAETGMTLRRWRILNRLHAASGLLQSGAAVDAVAHRVGYTSVNAFRRVFADHYGMTPTEYTRRMP